MWCVCDFRRFVVDPSIDSLHFLVLQFGASVGTLIAATVGLTLKTPPAGQTGGAFRNSILEIGPMALGMASIYTMVSCVARDARGTDDWRNPFIGGGVAGAIAAGIKRRAIPAAIGGGVIMGAAAASPYWFAVMQPSIEEIAEKRENKFKPSTGVTSFAQPAQTATSLQRRLL